MFAPQRSGTSSAFSERHSFHVEPPSLMIFKCSELAIWETTSKSPARKDVFETLKLGL